MKIFAVATQSILAFVITSIAFVASGKSSAPVRLLVDGVCHPLAIDCGTARFTWMSEDDNRGARQTAYQILVASNPERLAAGKADWWNSGKVDSDRSASVVYAGKTLPPATRFWWKVRTWDQTEKPSPYSAPAYFDTGLNDWTARFIWDGTTNKNNFAYFRKTLVVTRKPCLAKVYVTGHNDYILYFNGHLLGRGPARCNPYRYGQYNSYDITKFLRNGTNVFAAIGHWQGTWHNAGINAKPAFMLEARLDYPDGSSSTMGTDGSWKVLTHTPFIETNPKYFGPGSMNRAAIRFDSRRDPVGWKKVGFNDSGWASATAVKMAVTPADLAVERLEASQIRLTWNLGGSRTRPMSRPLTMMFPTPRRLTQPQVRTPKNFTESGIINFPASLNAWTIAT